MKLIANDSKLRETDCANTEGIFSIIESIPSPKADAEAGGKIASDARTALESRLKKSVVTKKNFLK
ncbi:MAG: hypothetical protein ACD_40C00003G0011 [uncultured bacterium]|nr:MAG: hypothetical protein ACD_40C00003G0011 [uncultured bacterium]